ncbi:MAG: response regulator [Desulfobacterales bacterium]|nr:response regulator [Desulfobacterales bacterium]
MAGLASILKGKRILAVDDDPEILETIEEILDESKLDLARDYESASEKIKTNRYDMVVLDIMGVDGMRLLDEAVARSQPAVMLTAFAINPETLTDSIRAGALGFLPKETLDELDEFLGALLNAHEQGEPTWKLLFEKLGGYFDDRFGPGWKENNKEFWADFGKTYIVGKGIQKRLLHDQRILDKGV